MKSVFIVQALIILILISVIVMEIVGRYLMALRRRHIIETSQKWLFSQMEEAYLFVDKDYGFVHANKKATIIFQQLYKYKKHERIPEDVIEIFNAKGEQVVISGMTFKCRIQPIEVSNSIEGYAMWLRDISSDMSMQLEVDKAKRRAAAAEYEKTTFMSNMSHEIRTPLNATVGLSEMLLSKDLLPEERIEYLKNIKASGEAMLTILDDILDYSDLEADNLKIVYRDYEPITLIRDLSVSLLNRIGGKKIEMLFDIDPELPTEIYGDDQRVRQIIMSIVNSAVKFTKEGFVKLTVRVEKVELDNITLFISVKDSGLGFKDADIEKLFMPFEHAGKEGLIVSQEEGTGLELSIAKMLVELMGGGIQARSEYGKGTEIYFTLRQKLRDSKPAAVLYYPNKTICAYTKSSLTFDGLYKLAVAYGVTFVSHDEMISHGVTVDYFFTDIADYDQEQLREISPKVQVVMLQNPLIEIFSGQNAILMNKPMFSDKFCKLLNGDVKEDQTDNSGQERYFFVAPHARVLVVDDNEINRKVLMGLLEPLQMKIDCAENGVEAVDMVAANHYHLVFMDHMMPVMDGVEAVQKIRAKKDAYSQNLAIIALSANVLQEARDQFMEAGMNDFYAKPVRREDLFMALFQWLPKKCVELTKEPTIDLNQLQSTMSEDNAAPAYEIEGVDVAAGIANSGSEKLFLELLGDYYKIIDMKSEKIEKCLADHMVRDYTIEVHALKNSSRMIGALELSAQFLHLEELGNQNDEDALILETPDVLNKYRSYKLILREYAVSLGEQKEVTTEAIKDTLQTMRKAMDEFDLDEADRCMKELDSYIVSEERMEDMDRLRAYVADVAMEEVMNLCDELMKKLSVDS